MIKFISTSIGLGLAFFVIKFIEYKITKDKAKAKAFIPEFIIYFIIAHVLIWVITY